MAASPNQFQPVTTPAPDWSAPVNWSEREIPAGGSAAIIAGTTAAVDPNVTLSADLALEPGGNGKAALIGNGGAFTLGDQATLVASNALGAMNAELFATDSLVNQGLISVSGAGTALDVVVDLGAITGQPNAPAPSFSNQGLISVAEGGLFEVAGTEFRNAGGIMLEGGTLDVTGGTMIDTGYIQLGHAALARFSDGVEFQHFDFTGQATISLADPWIGPGVTLSGFGAGDEIDLTSQQTSRLQIGADALTLLNGNGVTEGTLNLAAPLAPDYQFAMVKTATGSAIIAQPDTPCFAAGTGILTPSGYRPVEALRPGDPVVTASGGTATLIWTGFRPVDIAVHPRPDAVRPIRIMPGALGAGLPRQVLRLSPDHALYLDGVLIPVKHLLNGATIIRETTCASVTYHHLELARHAVILAEGAPCETYLDTGNRRAFTNARSGFSRNKTWDRDACAPLCIAGPVLRAVRQRLLDRAALLGFRQREAGEVSLWMGDAPLRRLSGAPGRHEFALPARRACAGRADAGRACAGRATIRSASFIPADFEAGSDDGRRLGVALAGVILDRGAARLRLGGGFHPRAAGDGAIWTDGNGEIIIPREACRVTLHLAALPRVWETPR